MLTLKEYALKQNLAVFGHELTSIPPYEEIFEKKIGFTDPDKAAEFVNLTGVDWLSVSAGSIHGAISGAAKDKKKVCARIDIEHLAEINRKVGIPLVLHGGTGISPECLKQAVENGITKINIGTEIRQAYEEGLKSDRDTAIENVKNTVRKLIEVYQIQNSAAIFI